MKIIKESPELYFVCRNCLTEFTERVSKCKKPKSGSNIYFTRCLECRDLCLSNKLYKSQESENA